MKLGGGEEKETKVSQSRRRNQHKNFLINPTTALIGSYHSCFCLPRPFSLDFDTSIPRFSFSFFYPSFLPSQLHLLLFIFSQAISYNLNIKFFVFRISVFMYVCVAILLEFLFRESKRKWGHKTLKGNKQRITTSSWCWVGKRKYPILLKKNVFI